MKRTAKFVTLLTPVALAAVLLVALMLVTRPPQTTAQGGDTIILDDPRVDDWVITVNISDATMHVINASKDIVYGPFLEGELGNPNEGLLDIAVTPDGKTALVSNFGGSAVYFVDISNPISPSFVVSVTTPMFAEDIAITPDGRYALVSDGGLSSLIASIDILSPSLVYTANLGMRDAQAVEVAANGTVIAANYLGGTVETLLISATGELTHTNTYTNLIDGESPWPINVGLAPDGETVIVTYAFTDAVGIYRVIGPGVLTFTGIVTGLPGNQQSVAFSLDGRQAFVVSEAPTPTDKLSVLDITAPGQVTLSTAGAADLFADVSGSFFGVDTIAVAAGKAYVGFMSTSNVTRTHLSVVDLTSFDVYTLPVGAYPHGVTAIPPLRQVIVTKEGSGGGTVSSEPPGVDCGITCTTLYDYGTVVTLTAVPDIGSLFDGWSGACSGGGGCAVPMTETKWATATFTLETHPLTVTTQGTGAGHVTSEPPGVDCGVTCTTLYDFGTVVTLTAVPDTGSLFDGWSGACSGGGPCSVTMTETKWATVTFTLETYQVTVTLAGTGAGHVGSEPPGIDCGVTCTADFDYSTLVTLTATADAESSFAGWSGGCTGKGVCAVTVTMPLSVTATFDSFRLFLPVVLK
jgi:hypothetical protein